jgi:hypothetical protein
LLALVQVEEWNRSWCRCWHWHWHWCASANSGDMALELEHELELELGRGAGAGAGAGTGAGTVVPAQVLGARRWSWNWCWSWYCCWHWCRLRSGTAYLIHFIVAHLIHHSIHPFHLGALLSWLVDSFCPVHPFCLSACPSGF